MKTYEDGLNEAWELARNVISSPNSENKSFTWVRENVIGSDIALFDIIMNYSASEIIEEMKKYEEIKVGDEVTDGEGWEGVVTRISPDGEYLIILQKDGTSLHWEKEHFKKTGRHFPQIAEVLQKMQEGEEN